MDDDSEYERQRQANIARNKELLRQLELADLGSSLAASTGASTSALKRSSSRNSRSTSSPASKRAKKKESLLPQRASARIKGLDPENKGIKDEIELTYKTAEEKDAESRTRVPGTVKFEDISADGLAQAWTFDDAEDIGDAQVKGEHEDKVLAKNVVQLRKDMSSLKLYERFAPNEIKIVSMICQFVW